MLQRNLIKKMGIPSIGWRYSGLSQYRNLSRSWLLSQKQGENRLNDFIKQQESLREKKPKVRNAYGAAEQNKKVRISNVKEISPNSNPTNNDYRVDVKDLSNRWERMTLDDKQDILNYLDVKQSFAWPHLSKDEKKAIYYISFGKWGPRNHPPMTVPEMIFRGLTSIFLFGAFGFAMVNYRNDRKMIQELEKGKKLDEQHSSSVGEE